MYVLGPDKQFLCKSVMSTGRLMILRELFPDVKVIYLVRNPYEAVPSFIKMFTSSWKVISPAGGIHRSTRNWPTSRYLLPAF
jgi:hypothetical protein